MHQRRIIRNSITERIKDATAAQDRVWASREVPANVTAIIEEGPIVLVYTREDRKADAPQSGRDSAIKRTVEIAVEVTAAGAFVVDDKLDDLADEIEALLEGHQVAELPSAELMLVSTQIDSTDEFEQPLGGALLMYEATYWRPYRTGGADEAEHGGNDGGGEGGEGGGPDDPFPWENPDIEFFPEDVSSSPNGETPAVVADCGDCTEGECP